MTRCRAAGLGGLVLAVAGCSGGPTLAPVSGVVTLDGAPYGKAVVSFQPIASSGNAEPGRGSSAYTDENGRFVLRYDGTADGAVVGKHLVRIMTKGSEMTTAGADGGSPDGAGSKREVDPIPVEWSALSKKEFEVPVGGTDKANFDIVSNKAAKKDGKKK